MTKEKPKIIWSTLYDSYVVIYMQPENNLVTIKKGFSKSEAETFAQQKEEELEHPILWYANN